MLLNVSNVRKAFGTDEVLTGVTFRLDRREKVALVGRNGTGKTTLLKILTGQMEPDAGSVNIARGAKRGYLKQEAPVDKHRTVLEEAEEARKHALELQDRLRELEARLEQNATEEDLEEYATLHEHFVEAEGYNAERDLRTVLLRMGFHEDELDKPAAKLSGGETTRLALARLILEEPDLLILDEPTNHLDLQATEWLEGWLKSYPGAVLLVSHDRAFLENVGDRVLEMDDGKVRSYPGPFPKYLRLRAEEDVRQAEVAKRQQENIDKLDEFVRRFMNSQRTAQARGKLKMMNKLIKAKVEAPKSAKGMAASVKATKRSGDVVVSCETLSIGFESGHLIDGLDWTVRLGERWGIVGENGSGKSTLIRTILGLREPQGGVARLGTNVEAGYFAQDASELDPRQSPLDFMVYECGLLPAEARDLLGRYLIRGDDVFRPIGTFSGGEKNKLSLARLTAMNPNLLVLDEPTNHLDMASREALAEVLAGYNGTLILVSHDRWLLSKATNHTLDIRRDGVTRFNGSYEEYRRPQRSTPAKNEPEQRHPNGKPEASSQMKNPPATFREPRLSPREVSKEIQRLEKVVSGLEARVTIQERELSGIEKALAKPIPDANLFQLTLEHQDLQLELGKTLKSWEEESKRLISLKAMQG